ncbi:transposase [Kitasatospora sp. NPDC017646]|uniref:transposase n=1 Tax=Kitasatospora sp. NPDC017646 TaxID=3364024 RepID=UPI003790058A
MDSPEYAELPPAQIWARELDSGRYHCSIRTMYRILAAAEPLLPERTPKRGRRWRDHRQVIDAIAFKYRTGTAWTDLPGRFGSWKGVYNWLRTWARTASWRIRGRRPSGSTVTAARWMWCTTCWTATHRYPASPCGARPVFRRSPGAPAARQDEPPDPGSTFFLVVVNRDETYGKWCA